MCILTTRIFSCVGFQLTAAKFFYFALVLSLTSIAAASIAFAISALVTVTGLANLFIAMLFVFQMVNLSEDDFSPIIYSLVLGG